MFENFLQQINNRELAIITWLVVFVVWFSLSKQVKNLELKNLFQAFFQRKICLPICILIVYQICIIYLLQQHNVWTIDLLKDSIYAILGVVGILFSLHEQKKDFILKLLIRLFQFSLVIELIGETYIFNYWIELVLVFVLTMLSMLIAFSSNKPEHKLTHTYLQHTINIIYATYFVVLIYHFLSSPGDIVEYNTILGFLLPIILMIVSLPILYLYKIIMEYEMLFVRMRNIFQGNPNLRRKLKGKIFLLCHINLGKLSKISASNLWFHQNTNSIEDYHNLIEGFHKLLKE